MKPIIKTTSFIILVFIGGYLYGQDSIPFQLSPESELLGYGNGTFEKSLTEYFNYLNKKDFVESNDSIAFEVGKYLFKCDNFNEAFQLISKTTHYGDPYIYYYLGLMYYYGLGTEKNDSLSFYWHKKAAVSGHKFAQRNMAAFYFYGFYAEKNHHKALKWAKESVKSGNYEAYNDLGILYLEGEGIPHDTDKGLAYLQKAVNAGFPNAHYNLGRIYNEGIGVQKDSIVACKWYSEACTKGHNEACDLIKKSKIRYQDHLTKFNKNRLLECSSENVNFYKVKKDEKWALFSCQDGLLTDFEFDEIDRGNEQLCCVQKDNLWGIYCYNGNQIDQKFNWITNARDMDYFGFYAYIGKLKGKGYNIEFNHKGKFYWFDKEGNILTPDGYNKISKPREGMAVVRQNKQYGYINNKGVEVIPCQYELAKDFNNGIAQVKKNGTFFYIDKSGNRK